MRFVGTVFALILASLPLFANAADNFLVVAKAEGLNTLVDVLQLSGLASALQSGGSDLTVLGPTDAAFGKLPAELVVALTKKYNSDILTKILLYHVFGDDISSALVTAAIGSNTPATLEGSTIAVTKPGSSIVLNGASNIIKVDVPFSNQARVGVLHLIDSVLVPPQLQLPTQTVTDIVAGLWQQGRFLQFQKYASKFGNLIPDLLKTFTDNGFTVFLPTDAAFQNFPRRFDEDLTLVRNRKCRNELRNILFFHVVRGYFPSSALRNRQQLTTYFDPRMDRLRVQVINGVYRIERSIVTEANIRASNGVIHVINKVLFPTQ